MRILVVGNGGREHAITLALSRSRYSPEICAYLGHPNPGIVPLCRHWAIGPLRDVKRIANFAWEQQVDLVIVGPEEPLIYGLADEMSVKGIPCVGPYCKLALLEGDKAYMRQMVAKYAESANPFYRICTTADEVHQGLSELEAARKGIVVKPTGLTGGKGVKVMGIQLATTTATEKYALEILRNEGKVLLEERLLGEEFSQMVFTDGVKVVPMPLVQDAKYAYEGDTGPMTGGMGSFSMPDHSLPFITPAERDKAIEQLRSLLQGVQEEIGMRYHGILYGQFMITNRGPFLVEVNVRFGDPEAINILSILQDDPVDVFAGMVCGLSDNIKFERKATVCKYLVPEVYPDVIHDKRRIFLDWNVFKKEGTQFIFAGAEFDGEGYCPTGSRFAAVLAVRPDLAEANAAVERTLSQIDTTGLRYRRDIANTESIQRKQERMLALKAV